MIASCNSQIHGYGTKGRLCATYRQVYIQVPNGSWTEIFTNLYLKLCIKKRWKTMVGSCYSQEKKKKIVCYEKFLMSMKYLDNHVVQSLVQPCSSARHENYIKILDLASLTWVEEKYQFRLMFRTSFSRGMQHPLLHTAKCWIKTANEPFFDWKEKTTRSKYAR